jgi:predicted nucleic acid-binding Zn ribbon protein
MARRDLVSAGELLPKVLAMLARNSGDASPLAPLWARAAGPLICRHSRPLSLEGDTLVVGVTSAAWAAELRKHEEHLRGRLDAISPGSRISKLSFRVVPCGR